MPKLGMVEEARMEGIDVEHPLSGCVLEDQSGGLPRAKPEDMPVVAEGSGAPDYPFANWVGSPNHFTGRQGQRITKLIVHTVQGTYQSCVNWFQNSAAQASAHFVISGGGTVTQMVRDQDAAWHVGSENLYCWGTEHEGWVDDGTPPQELMLIASAKLFASKCKQYGLDPDRDVLGHRDLPRQTHTDPGNEWPMPRFKTLIKHFMGTYIEPVEVPLRKYNFVCGKDANWAKDRALWIQKALGGTPLVGVFYKPEEVLYVSDQCYLGEYGAHECIVTGTKAVPALSMGAQSVLGKYGTDDSDIWDGRYGPRLRDALALIVGQTGKPKSIVSDFEKEFDISPKADAPAIAVRKTDSVVGAFRISLADAQKAFGQIGASPEFIKQALPAIYAEYDFRIDLLAYGILPDAPDAVAFQAYAETGGMWHRADGRYYRNRSTGEVGDSGLWNLGGIKRGDAEKYAPEPGGFENDSYKMFERPASAEEGARMLFNHRAAYLGTPTRGTLHGRYALAKSVGDAWFAKNGRRPTRMTDWYSIPTGGIWGTDPQGGQKLLNIQDQVFDMLGRR